MGKIWILLMENWRIILAMKTDLESEPQRWNSIGRATFSKLPLHWREPSQKGLEVSPYESTVNVEIQRQQVFLNESYFTDTVFSQESWQCKLLWAQHLYFPHAHPCFSHSIHVAEWVSTIIPTLPEPRTISNLILLFRFYVWESSRSPANALTPNNTCACVYVSVWGIPLWNVYKLQT